jgi:hypothetical protein
MPKSQFDTAHLDGTGSLTVSGPIYFAEEEQLTTMVTSLSFVVVQGDEFVQGSGSVQGQGDWGGVAKLADQLEKGPAHGFGAMMLVTRAQPATVASGTQPATPARPPVVQTLTWSEAVTITS